MIRLQALALDYDSTLASHDHLTDPNVAAGALLRASLTGLVAGRI